MVKTNAISVASSQQMTRPVFVHRTTGRNNTKAARRNRGLDEISPFLHQVQKIVSEECTKHETVETTPWYKTCESWMQWNLLLKISMNSVTVIIVPDSFYNQRTVKVVVEKCIDDIHPITTYIEITHLTNKSVTWVPRVDIDSFQTVKKKRGRHRNPQNCENEFWQKSLM